MSATDKIYQDRASYSRQRLAELRTRFSKLSEVTGFPNLTIFSAGSYARLEASEHSDLDLFFLCETPRDKTEERKTKSLRMFGKIINSVEEMNFPKFSNDCEFLELLYADEILENLGGRTDDHLNFFTARMLLLLESQCLFGDASFKTITSNIVSSYFKDYPDHKQTFMPMFLLNDICRFWKTLLLNYEHKRNVRDPDSQERQVKQKVRNFKLKYSRMTTCFASIAALGSHLAPVKEEHVLNLLKLTPHERLKSVAERIDSLKGAVEDVLERYAWFLEQTAKPKEELESMFVDKQKRGEMFQKANEYGDTMFDLLKAIDSTEPKFRLFRNLVV